MKETLFSPTVLRTLTANVDQRDASLVLGNGPAQPGCTATRNNQAIRDPDGVSG